MYPFVVTGNHVDVLGCFSLGGGGELVEDIVAGGGRRLEDEPGEGSLFGGGLLLLARRNVNTDLGHSSSPGAATGGAGGVHRKGLCSPVPQKGLLLEVMAIEVETGRTIMNGE